MNIYMTGMLISMAIYIVLGFLISRKVKDANDFYVAGHNAPTSLIVGSLVASYCSTNFFMGDSGEAYNGIFSPMLIGSTILLIGYVLGAVFFGRYLRRSNATTIAEFLGQQFDSKAVRILATITETVTLVVYLLSVMQGIGMLMQRVSGIPYDLCVALSLAALTILTAASGATGVLISDTIMFGIFTLATIVSVLTLSTKAGGWYQAVETVTAMNEALLSWCGDLTYFYPRGSDNMIWTLSFGLVWTGVCMVGPWQASRYLMAKNEHVVIRSSVWACFGVFLLTILIFFGAIFVRVFAPDLEEPSYVFVWAAMNILPPFLGVIFLTGILAAGISSATTFLSLVGSAVANDMFQISDEKKRLRIGRFAIVLTAVLVLYLSYHNSYSQMFWIRNLGSTVIASSWLPVCIASIWSKRVTKAGAFWGMLAGFLGCAGVKAYTSVSSELLPPYFDPFFVGIALNVVIMVIVSAITKVTPNERIVKERIMVMPESEKDPSEIRKTKFSVLMFIALGAFVTVTLILLWVIPYTQALK